MHYAVLDDFRPGMPQTVLAAGFRPRGIACHTTEGAEGEAGALLTIQFLIDRADRNASYHEMWYPKAGGFEARRIVRPDRAAHSMNPAQPPWSPNDRVRRILADRWADPNAWAYAVSIAGTTATTIPKLIADPGFMAGARRRLGELLVQFSGSFALDPLFNHGEGQSDRSDWGPLMRPALLATPPEDDDMLTWLPVEEEWDTGTGDTTASSRTGPAGGQFWAADPVTRVPTLKHFIVSEVVTSSAESHDGMWRLVRYGSEILVMHRFNLRNPRNRRPQAGYGFPAPDTTDRDALLAQIAALNQRIATKDAHVAAYPKG